MSARLLFGLSIVLLVTSCSRSGSQDVPIGTTHAVITIEDKDTCTIEIHTGRTYKKAHLDAETCTGRMKLTVEEVSGEQIQEQIVAQQAANERERTDKLYTLLERMFSVLTPLQAREP